MHRSALLLACLLAATSFACSSPERSSGAGGAEGGAGGGGGDPADAGGADLPPVTAGVAGTCQQACAALGAAVVCIDSVQFCGRLADGACAGPSPSFLSGQPEADCRAACEEELGLAQSDGACDVPTGQGVRDFLDKACTTVGAGTGDGGGDPEEAPDDCLPMVKFTIFRAKLAGVRAGMARYAQPNGGGPRCVVDEDALDLSVMPTYMIRDRDLGRTRKVLLRPEDALGQCVLRMGEARDEPGVCFLGTDDVALSQTRASLESQAGEPICCGAACPDDGIDCDTLGDGWACDDGLGRCHQDLSMNTLSVDFHGLGARDEPRLLALVMDNSGSLDGSDDGAPDPTRATDRTADGRQDFRIAAARELASSLGASDEVALYTFDTAGAAGVISRTAVAGCGGDSGFAGAVDDCLGEAILGLGRATAASAGSPAWDAVTRAVEDLRGRKSAAQGRGAPAIVLFTDGPADGSAATAAEAIAAARGEEADPDDDIPVFVVHLDNVVVMAPATGRHADYEEIACATGGAYYRVESADHLHDAFGNHLPLQLQGSYTLRLGYSEMKLADSFPTDSCYAIAADVSVTIDGVEVSVSLSRRSSLIGGGAPFDTRMHVCKP